MAGILTRAAAAAAATEQGPETSTKSEDFGRSGQADQGEGGVPAAEAPSALPSNLSTGAISEGDDLGETLGSESSGDADPIPAEQGHVPVPHPSSEPQDPGEQTAPEPESNAHPQFQSGAASGRTAPEKAGHRLTLSFSSAPVTDPPLASPDCTPRAKDPLRASFEDFNLPLQTVRPDSRLKKGEGRGTATGAEKENEEGGGTPALLPGGASPIGKGSLLEKHSAASKLRLGSIR